MDLSRTSTIFVATYPREGTETKIGRRQERKCAIVATYPREGTETEGGAVAPFVPVCCNLSPRGDGNPCRDLPSRRGCNRCNLSPRGDGNTISCPGFFGNTKGVATYPREGTETKLIFGDFLQVVRLQLIPARGRKLIIVRKAVENQSVATYPREGTETPPAIQKCFLHQLQLIPARGRKMDSPQRIPLEKYVATYPREGTETTLFLCWSHSTLSLQLIPARGRKLSALLFNLVPCQLQLIPARGRKRHCAGDGAFAPCCNLSPRGDGNSKSHSASPLCSQVATYPREGTETLGLPSGPFP